MAIINDTDTGLQFNPFSTHVNFDISYPLHLRYVRSVRTINVHLMLNLVITQARDRSYRIDKCFDKAIDLA